MEIRFNPFSKEAMIPQEERAFTTEQVMRDLEKFNLGDTTMAVNGVKANTQGLAKIIYEHQGSEADEQQAKEVAEAFSYMSQFPKGESTLWTLWEIKQELLKYKLPNNIFVSIAQAIQRVGSEKGGHDTDAIETTEEVVNEEHVHETVDAKREMTIDTLLENPNLLHIVSGTYSGSGTYRIFSGGKDLSVESPQRNELNLRVRDLTGLPSTLHQELFGDDTPFEARPAIMAFPQGTGYGIVYSKYDDLNRLGYGSFWIVVPETETETAEYLVHNPEIILDTFKEKLNTSPHNGRVLDESNGRLHLVSDKFVNIYT